MRSTDFFVEEEDPNWAINGDPWAATTTRTTTRLDDELLEAVRRAPADGTSDVSVAAGLLDLVQEELEAYGTSGEQQLDDRQIGLAIRALTSVTRRLGAPLELPFRDFTRFRTYWNRNGGHGSWQARRDMLEQLFETDRQALTRVEEQQDAGRPQLWLGTGRRQQLAGGRGAQGCRCVATSAPTAVPRTRRRHCEGKRLVHQNRLVWNPFDVFRVTSASSHAVIA